MTEQEYEQIINFKKHEFQANGWNALDLNAGRLLASASDIDENIGAVNTAMHACMLEGDQFLSEDREGASMTVRYYCDNLSEQRRKYSE